VRSLPATLEPVLAVLAAALTVGALALAWRQPRPRHPQVANALLAIVDQDGDGRVSAPEYARVSDGELSLALLDVDDSGALEPWELELAISYISPLQPQQNLLPRAR